MNHRQSCSATLGHQSASFWPVSSHPVQPNRQTDRQTDGWSAGDGDESISGRERVAQLGPFVEWSWGAFGAPIGREKCRGRGETVWGKQFGASNWLWSVQRGANEALEAEFWREAKIWD